MSPKTAKAILEQLAHEIDPDTGEILNAPGVLRSPQVIEALVLGAEALNSKNEKPRSSNPALPAAGKSWTREEDMLLAASFDQGKSVDEMARIHGRSIGGIAARMVRLGIIKDRAEAYGLGKSPEQEKQHGREDPGEA